MIDRPAWVEVDLDAIAHNVAAIGALVAPAEVCGVIKDDGYGHGAVPTALACLRGGATCLALALTQEGVKVREAGIDVPIQVLSQATPGEVDDLVGARLDATVYSEYGIANLVRAAKAAGRAAADPVPVHLKVDTGMHRVGCRPEEAVGLAAAIAAAPELRLAGVFTHCAVADEPGNPFTDVQLDRFDQVLSALGQAGIEVPRVHAANTAAALDHPRSRFDVVRCGIGIYGLSPASEMEIRIDLRPALSLKARVGHVKRIEAGESVSYGMRYTAERDTTIATIGLGYGDGVPRNLADLGGRVLVAGTPRPMAGTITMDQLCIDCGDTPVMVGDEVVLLGQQGDHRLEVQEWADRLGTITYEIVARLSPRLPRIHLESRP